MEGAVAGRLPRGHDGFVGQGWCARGGHWLYFSGWYCSASLVLAMASASLEASLDLLERMRCHVFLFAQRADVWGFLPSWALVMVVVCCVSGKFAAEAGSSRATTSRLWPVSASTVAYDFIWWAPLFSRRGLWAVLLLFSLYGLLSELCRSCIRFLAWCIISLYTCKATRFRPGPAFMSACRYCVLWIGGRLFGQSQTDSSCEACSGRQAHRVFPHPSGWGCEIFFSDLSSFFSFFFFFSSSPPGSHLPIGDDGIHQYPSDSLPAHTFQLATTGSTSIPQTPSDSLRLPPTIGDSESPSVPQTPSHYWRLRIPQYPSDSLRLPPTIGDSESPSVPQTPSHYWRFRIPQYPSDSLRRPPTIGDSESPSVPQTLSHYWRLRIPQCPSYSLPLLATQNPPVSLIISPTIGDSESPSVPQNPSHYWRLRIPQYPSESLIIIIIIIRIPPPPPHHHQNPSSASSSSESIIIIIIIRIPPPPHHHQNPSSSSSSSESLIIIIINRIPHHHHHQHHRRHHHHHNQGGDIARSK